MDFSGLAYAFALQQFLSFTNMENMVVHHAALLLRGFWWDPKLWLPSVHFLPESVWVSHGLSGSLFQLA